MGLFSKSKDKSEQKDATDIKQATISDSQKNSIQTDAATNASSDQGANVSAQPSNDANFVNPFSAQSNASQNTTAQQNPFETQNNVQGNMANNPMNSQGASGQPLDQQQTNPVGPQQNDPMASINAIQQSSQQQNSTVDFDKIQEMIDETVEKIIEEKWNTLEEKVNKVLRWKETKDSEINMLKEDLVALADGFNKLEMKLINKISNYDKNILDVNSEIKALEKVFQKVTPTLINNVNELSKIADDFKGVEHKKRKAMTEDDFKVEPEEDNNKTNSKK